MLTYQENDPLVQVVWKPIKSLIPGQRSSQERAMATSANVILLTGGRGWGKTELQLMRFASRVGMGYGVYWRGIIFDREYKNLDDLVTKSKRLFKDLFGEDAQFLSSNSAFKWVWKTGEELLFRVAAKEDDYWSYHGHEYSFVGWNELTKYPTGALFQRMLSVNRTGFNPIEHTPTVQRLGGNNGPEWTAEELAASGLTSKYATPDGKPLPPIPLEVVATTNPYGPGHNWVKRRFIDPVPYGKKHWKEYDIFNPQTGQDEIIRRSQVAIFGTFRENPYLSPQYIAGMYDENDENIIKAWINGSWDIVAGGALDDVWRRSVHVLPRFKVPPGWAVNRAFDWGSTHPFSVGWFAEANGEEVTLPNGKVFCPPSGTIIQIAELYGTKELGTNIGVKWTAEKIATTILQKESQLLLNGWIPETPMAGPADNQISNVNEASTETIETMMARAGVHWIKSDKGRGSRKIGLELTRTRLVASRKGEGQGLYFLENCVASIGTIPILPRDEDDPDDVDTEAEDHPFDMLRYRLLQSSFRAPGKLTARMG